MPNRILTWYSAAGDKKCRGVRFVLSDMSHVFISTCPVLFFARMKNDCVTSQIQSHSHRKQLHSRPARSTNQKVYVCGCIPHLPWSRFAPIRPWGPLWGFSLQVRFRWCSLRSEFRNWFARSSFPTQFIHLAHPIHPRSAPRSIHPPHEPHSAHPHVDKESIEKLMKTASRRP